MKKIIMLSVLFLGMILTSAIPKKHLSNSEVTAKYAELQCVVDDINYEVATMLSDVKIPAPQIMLDNYKKYNELSLALDGSKVQPLSISPVCWGCQCGVCGYMRYLGCKFNPPTCASTGDCPQCGARGCWNTMIGWCSSCFL